MILVADSGSTKADWLYSNGSKRTEKIKTVGFNPFFHDVTYIYEELCKSDGLREIKSEVDKVYFYGAGCSDPSQNIKIEEAFSKFFDRADLNVGHDLMAAAYASGIDKPSISCIIGTGSNSCFFDGEAVSESVPALGYILGDEASGSYLGKRLLSAYLYRQLPAEIHKEVEARYQLDKNEIFKNVYMKPNANVYLASFAKFFSDHRSNDFLMNWIKEGFEDFCNVHVKCFDKCYEVPVNFVGSIAYYFEHILEEVLDAFGLEKGKIIKRPVYNLLDHHLMGVGNGAEKNN